MRLLKLNDDCSFSLALFSKDRIPPYAILSHTWGRGEDDEVTFKDLIDATGNNKKGFRKLRFCGNQAKADDLHYFWVDTCCIDKSNNNELTTAINSMFRWYHNAARCYVYLSDVSVHTQGGQIRHVEWESAFRNSRWFTRGWTLQELLAPETVEFYSQDHVRLGDKTSLQQIINETTGIAVEALQGCLLSEFTVDDLLQWKAGRQTTEEEDMAYCLLGIFDVFMPLIYGEGYEKAMKRLLREVAESGRNDSQSLGDAVDYQTNIRLKGMPRVHNAKTRMLEGSHYRSNIYQHWRFIPGLHTLITASQIESSLWVIFVVISSRINFYWTITSISFCLTRLLYLGLVWFSSSLPDTQPNAPPWRYSISSKKCMIIIGWFYFTVAITWCSSLTPLRLITPTYMDIWKPYLEHLPVQFSESLGHPPLQHDFLMHFNKARLLATDTNSKKSFFVVPKPRNKIFIQRQHVMSLMEEKLLDKSRLLDARVVLYGLGGIGKTQCALEYCYRARDWRLNGHIFWISGEKKQFIEDYYKIASKVNLTVSRSNERQSLEAVQEWLESNEDTTKPWLLVVDGLDDVDAPHFQFLPKHGGQIILTGRSEDLVTRFADPINGIYVDKMERKEAKRLFTELTLLPEAEAPREVEHLLEELERLPLAILQAATFIRQVKHTHRQPVLWYLERFRASIGGQQDLLSRSRKTIYIDSDASSGVMTTWKITFDYLASEHPKSVALFKMMVYLSPVQIPANIFHAQISEETDDELITTAKKGLSPFLFDKINVQDALGTLTAFSFLSYSSDENTFDIHRLVRLAMLVELEDTSETLPFTQMSVVLALAFPAPALSNVMECSKLYPHVEDFISPGNMAAAKDPVSRSLRLNLLLRSMLYLRLHSRSNEALQLAGQIYKEKEALLEGACSHISSRFTIDLMHAASLVCNDLEEYRPAKEIGELEYELLKKAYGETHYRAIRSLNHLAWVETLPEGDHSKAKDTFEKVIQLTYENPELRHINIEAKRGLSMLLRDMNQLCQAFQVMSEAVEALGKTYGEQSVEFAIGLADLADLQWRDEINQKMQAGANKAQALPILVEHLGPHHPKVLTATYNLATFIIHFDRANLDYAVNLFQNLVETPASLISQSYMDPIEMCDGLAVVLGLKGTPEALEEAVCLARRVVAGFQRLKGMDHPRTKKAWVDLKRVERRWRNAIKWRNREPRESRWLQGLREREPYDSQQTC